MAPSFSKSHNSNLQFTHISIPSKGFELLKAATEKKDIYGHVQKLQSFKIHYNIKMSTCVCKKSDIFIALADLIMLILYRPVPNVLALFHFKKVSQKETVFNQSNGRKFKNSLFAQENSLTEQRDYF